MDFFALSNPAVDPMTMFSGAASSIPGKSDPEGQPPLEVTFKNMLLASESEIEPDLPSPIEVTGIAEVSQPPAFSGLIPIDVTTRLDDIAPSTIPQSQMVDVVANAYAAVVTMPAPQHALETMVDLDPVSSVIESKKATPVIPVPVETSDVSFASAPDNEERSELVSGPVQNLTAADIHTSAFIRVDQRPNISSESFGSSSFIREATRADAALDSENEASFHVPADRVDFLLAPVAPPESVVSQQLALTNESPKTIPQPAPFNAEQVAPRHSNDTVAIASEVRTQTSEAPVVLEARIVPKDSQQSERIATDTASKATEAETTPAILKAAPIERAVPIADDPEDEPEYTARTMEAKSQTPSFGTENSAPAQVSSEPLRPSKPAPELQTEMPKQPVAHIDEKPLSGAERQPLKHLDLRIPDANGDVTVRVQERAGAIQVTVRSADTHIAGGVAEGLPDLTRNLDRGGFRAETWTPQSANLRDVRTEEHSLVSHVHTAESNSSTRVENSRTEDDRTQSQQEPDWQDQQERRRKRQQEEDFKEYLW